MVEPCGEGDGLDRGARTRVLWCIKCLGYGGAERLLVSAAEVGDSSRFEYEAAYVLPSKAALVPELQAAGVPVHCLGSSDSNWDLRWLGRLRRLLAERRFDVVHLHLPLTASLGRLVVQSLPAPLRPKTVTTEHNLWATNPWPVRTLNSLTRHVDAAGFAVSDAVRRAMPPRHQRRVETLLHGVPRPGLDRRSAWRDEVRAELGVARDEVLIGTVANVRSGKGYEVLLPAARSLIDRGLPVRFAAVGVGPLENEIEEMHRRLRLGERFRLLGGRSDAMRVVAGFDVFVLASHAEGCPISVMEALALGVPVVATAVGGIPEMVTDGVEGLLVRPGRTDDLVQALSRVVTDAPTRSRMSAAAAARGALFDITPAVRRAEAVYLQMTSPGADARPPPCGAARRWAPDAPDGPRDPVPVVNWVGQVRP